MVKYHIPLSSQIFNLISHFCGSSMAFKINFIFLICYKFRLRIKKIFKFIQHLLKKSLLLHWKNTTSMYLEQSQKNEKKVDGISVWKRMVFWSHRSGYASRHRQYFHLFFSSSSDFRNKEVSSWTNEGMRGLWRNRNIFKKSRMHFNSCWCLKCGEWCHGI